VKGHNETRLGHDTLFAISQRKPIFAPRAGGWQCLSIGRRGDGSFGARGFALDDFTRKSLYGAGASVLANDGKPASAIFFHLNSLLWARPEMTDRGIAIPSSDPPPITPG
jgi:hypothetical protein